MVSIEPLNGVYLSSELRRLGADDHELRNAMAQGTLHRLSHGAYIQAAELEKLSVWEIYRLRCIAAALASRVKPTLSHVSAAVVWGIPTVGSPPATVHVLTSTAAGSRTEHGFSRHAVRDQALDVVEFAALPITSFVRTVVDYAASVPFAAAVAALDWAMTNSTPEHQKRSVTREQIEDCAIRIGLRKGRPAFERALMFAVAISGSVGESVSRANMHLVGLPAPDLQKEFSDSGGFFAMTDFDWPEYGLIGEFDGDGKYLRDEYTHGASAADIVLREKRREDRLRATETHPRVTRWGWSTAIRPQSLAAHLTAAGLPIVRRPLTR